MKPIRVPPGQSACPFHTQQLEDEIFFVLSGRGIFRYGDRAEDIRSGDTLSGSAATGVGHQIANPFDEDLPFLVNGMNDPIEVTAYPDSGQAMVPGLRAHGCLRTVGAREARPTPSIFATPVAERVSMSTTSKPAGDEAEIRAMSQRVRVRRRATGVVGRRLARRQSPGRAPIHAPARRPFLHV